MLRLLGILSLGGLIFGGRSRRRAMRRGLLLGAVLGFLVSRNPDMKHVHEDARAKAREARETAREAVRTARKELREARKEMIRQRNAERVEAVHTKIEQRKAEREQRLHERLDAIHAEAEARKVRKLQQKEESTREEQAEPASMGDGAQIIKELGDDLERDARTAAMAASVPTIQFPEEDERYHASGKYGYA